jgi:hypothetical protein
VIILGLLLLIVGWLLGIHLLVVLGAILLVIGVILLFLLGLSQAGRPVGGRNWW